MFAPRQCSKHIRVRKLHTDHYYFSKQKKSIPGMNKLLCLHCVQTTITVSPFDRSRRHASLLHIKLRQSKQSKGALKCVSIHAWISDQTDHRTQVCCDVLVHTKIVSLSTHGNTLQRENTRCTDIAVVQSRNQQTFQVKCSRDSCCTESEARHDRQESPQELTQRSKAVKHLTSSQCEC
jgi:hypothetical protein